MADPFVLELDTDGVPKGVYSFAAQPAPVIVGASNGDLFVTGTFDGATNFTSGCFGQIHDTAGHGDAYLLALSEKALSPARGYCPTSPTLPLRNQTSERLAGTGLPNNFDECKQAGGGVFTMPSGYDRCVFGISQRQNLQLIDECKAVGGGIVATESAEGNACRIPFPEYGPPCFGNLCD
jgi:hypothetical protein